MSQFYKRSFYFDETRERTISIEYNKGCREVYISEDGEEIASFNSLKQLIKGAEIKTLKGENLYIKVYVGPFRWEVMIGNRYLINSYNNSSNSLKPISNLFYFLSGGLSFLLLMSGLANGFDRILWFDLIMLINYAHIIFYLICGLILRKGKLWAYYAGTIIYFLNTAFILLGAFLNGSIGGAVFIFIVRGIFLYFLLKAYKHVNTLRKHQKDIAKKSDSELLDV